jgi:hypothetical protein
MNWKTLGILIVISIAMVTAIGVCRWLYVRSGAEGLQGYSQVVGGMTVDEVREIMGRKEDPPDERMTMTGEFERSWTFEDGARYTVVFDKNGRSIYKEIAPDYCGVTPLMGKYVKE